jgi:hypothetical protein
MKTQINTLLQFSGDEKHPEYHTYEEISNTYEKNTNKRLHIEIFVLLLYNAKRMKSLV